MYVLLKVLKKCALYWSVTIILPNIEVNHVIQYIYKFVFNNHHCVCIEKKKYVCKIIPKSQLVLVSYKVQKEVKFTQKQPNCEKMQP